MPEDHSMMDDMANFAVTHKFNAPQGRPEQGWMMPAEAVTEFCEDQTDSADGEVFPYLAMAAAVFVAVVSFISTVL